MNITPGKYAIEGWAYNVIGISTNTETSAKYVLWQQIGDSLHAEFFHLPLEEFVVTMGAHQEVVEAYEAPRLIVPTSFAHEIALGLYGHFKKKENTYNVIAISRDARSAEQCVVYQPLYGEHRHALCHRSKKMFFEHVERPDIDYSGPRFYLLDRHAEPHITAEYQD